MIFLNAQDCFCSFQPFAVTDSLNGHSKQNDRPNTVDYWFGTDSSSVAIQQSACQLDLPKEGDTCQNKEFKLMNKNRLYGSMANPEVMYSFLESLISNTSRPPSPS
jgi:hypothetical protein